MTTQSKSPREIAEQVVPDSLIEEMGLGAVLSMRLIAASAVIAARGDFLGVVGDAGKVDPVDLMMTTVADTVSFRDYTEMVKQELEALEESE